MCCSAFSDISSSAAAAIAEQQLVSKTGKQAHKSIDVIDGGGAWMTARWPSLLDHGQNCIMKPEFSSKNLPRQHRLSPAMGWLRVV
jgi:hypothetical protein